MKNNTKSSLFNVNFRDLSKKYQLIVTVTLLLLLISVGFSFLLPEFANKLLFDEFIKSQETILNLTADNLYAPLSFMDDDIDTDYLTKQFKDVTTATFLLENLTHIYVYDNRGTRIYSNVKDNIVSYIQLFRPKIDTMSYLEENMQLYIANKDIVYQGQKIGSLTLVFSLRQMYTNISTMKYQIIISCLVVLIVGIIITIVISRLISTPLEILLQTFNKIAQGELSLRADITTNEEFGQLARSFNKMVDSLEESYYELAEANRDMETKVEQRTSQLKEQIDVRLKAEDKLRVTNKMVTSVINTSPLPIITISSDFKVRTASPAIKSIFFLEEFEVVDKIVPIIYANEMDNFMQNLRKLTVPNQTEKFIIKGKKKNGQLLDLSIASLTEFDENDEVSGYILLVDDTTERLLAESALKESEIKYRSLIEDSIIGIGIVKDNVFSFANQATLDIWEYPNTVEFLSTPFIEMVKAEDRVKIIELFEMRDLEFDNNTVLPVLEIHIICYNGREKYVEMASNLLFIAGDTFFQITFVDISARKEAEKQMMKMNEELEDRVAERTSQLNKTLVELRSEMSQRSKLSKELQFKSEILERTTSVCIVFNAKGECIYISPWSLIVLGWSVDKLLGNGFWTTLKLKNIEGQFSTKEELIMIIKQELVVPSYYFTVEITSSTGQIKYLKLKHSLGQQNTLITAGADITEQILGQRELLVMSDRLAKSLEGEKELNDLKTRFISMVSHEFRTPLTVILSCSSVIEQAIESNRVDVTTQYLDKINKSVKTMNDLMEDVLTIGRAQSKKIEEVEETDFVTFVRNTLVDIQESYNFNTQAILDVIKTPSTFYSNEVALKHIVSNLITNALKYTTNGQDAHITVDEQDGNVVFVVADKGIGIPPDDMKRLFTNFHRAKNVGKIAGTGLGLHIVKQSVENLFGTIDVKSEVNVGTSFTVKLPLDIRDKIAEQNQEEKS